MAHSVLAGGASKECLRGHFKFSCFRPGQLDAVLPILHGKDVFVRMATGSGKSLCMFVPVPASYSSLVFSPLIGLMEQQAYEACNEQDPKTLKM